MKVLMSLFNPSLNYVMEQTVKHFVPARKRRYMYISNTLWIWLLVCKKFQNIAWGMIFMSEAPRSGPLLNAGHILGKVQIPDAK